LLSKQNKTWDRQAIDQVYESLIDEVRHFLDLIALTGCRSFLEEKPALRLYLHLIEELEQELLIQWNIKQEQGLEALFSRHKHWLGEELRNKDSFFETWNHLCACLWKKAEKPALLLTASPWQSLILQTFTDQDFWKDFRGALHTDQKQPLLTHVCQLFELLYKLDPHHQALSYLNLIEIGVEHRPEIYAIGETSQKALENPCLSLIQDHFLPDIQQDHWENMPDKLVEFWANNSGGIYSQYPTFRLDSELSIRGFIPTKAIEKLQPETSSSPQKRLMEELENFVQQGKGNNILLTGNKGSEKQSSLLTVVFSLLDQGLRLIQLTREDWPLLPNLMAGLVGKPEKFVLYAMGASPSFLKEQKQSLREHLNHGPFQIADNVLLIADLETTTTEENSSLQEAMDLFDLVINFD